jgi:hypothetical protein
MSGIKEGTRVEVLKDGQAGGSKISRGSKGRVISADGFWQQRFTVKFDSGATVSELLDEHLIETDLGFFRLGGRR